VSGFWSRPPFYATEAPSAVTCIPAFWVTGQGTVGESLDSRVLKEGRELQEVTKEVYGSEIHPIVLLFGDGIPHKLLRPVSAVKLPSALLRF
jgi:hypothetical protein